MIKRTKKKNGRGDIFKSSDRPIWLTENIRSNMQLILKEKQANGSSRRDSDLAGTSEPPGKEGPSGNEELSCIKDHILEIRNRPCGKGKVVRLCELRDKEVINVCDGETLRKCV